MDVQTVIQLISSVGFPITMCGAMGWLVVDQTNKHREDVSQLNKKHEEQMNTVIEAINNNTLALKELSVKLGGN